MRRVGYFGRSCAIALVAVFGGVTVPAHAQVVRVGGEFRVNAYTGSLQTRPDIALDADGDFVVTWSSFGQDGFQYGIFARRFSAAGVPLAVEFQLNSRTVFQQWLSAVDVATDGRFVVAWTSGYQDGAGGGVFARRFDAMGVSQAGEFQVTTHTQAYESSPDVAMQTDGGFVITWESFVGEYGDIFVQSFSSTGMPQATELQVNLYTDGSQSRPSIATFEDGRFIVVWHSFAGQDGSHFGVFGRRFDASGAPVGAEFQVNAVTENAQRYPSIGANADGFVVAWTDNGRDGSNYGVFARRFDADGVGQAVEFQVSSFTLGSQGFPGIDVAVDADGDFVIVWDSEVGQDGDSSGVFARRFDRAGTPQAVEFQVNTRTSSYQWRPTVDVAGNGDFVVAWNGDQDGDSGGIFAQRFAVFPKIFDIDGNGVVQSLTDGLLFLRYFFGFRGATLVTGAVALNCSRCTAVPIESYLAGLAAVSSAKKSGPELQVNSYTPGDQSLAAASADADGTFVVAWHSAHDGSNLGIFARRFDQNGAPLTAELQVNEYVTGPQAYPEVAMDADGDFVVVWQSDAQDGNGENIFARGFNSAGNPRAAQFQVNVSTVLTQYAPAIAMNAAGDFVVAWENIPDYFDYRVSARRFNAALTPVGGEFVVSGVSRYASPAVAMFPNGDFVVTWFFYGIFGRRFNAAGVALGGQFQASTYVGDLQGKEQSDPDVAAGGGGFVVSWTSQTQDGDGLGVFARRFDTAGAALGGEMQVNSYTTGNQSTAAVRAGASGEFVVTWTSAGQDGSGNGVFARRYDATGAPQATEIQVNKFTAGGQAIPALAMAPSGALVAAWQSAAQDGSGYGIFAQRFRISRVADIDGDGSVAALTDGLLFLRYAFGFRGATLISGAVGAGCTRCTAPAIETYIAGRV
jgi:hypothetical protein